MPSKKNNHILNCPITFALGIFGDKWSLLIVRDIMFRGRSTYGEFQDAGDGIATNILSDRLKRLETNGIITKQRDPDNGRKKLYQLTERGMALAPILLEMYNWSGKYDPHSGASKKILDGLKKDPKGLLEKIQSGKFKI
ncbi:Transcriptional regulator, HxlR family [hydrothermal vent metagenome]|uniref:Transcriptional regulator, HxlR family n=1 Tax=hydrothermal vent metagenome TaxID=652676 RepID=A0A3B0WLK5_9ZZZZ